MDFKTKCKDKGASGECLALSLKMLMMTYDMTSGTLDWRKKAPIHNHFLMISQKIKHKKHGNSCLYYSKNNEIVGR